MALISMTTTKNVVHTLRFVASFALLGAVVTGVGVGWIDHLPFDPRAFGAVGGAVFAMVVKAMHVV